MVKSLCHLFYTNFWVHLWNHRAKPLSMFLSLCICKVWLVFPLRTIWLAVLGPYYCRVWGLQLSISVFLELSRLVGVLSEQVGLYSDVGMVCSALRMYPGMSISILCIPSTWSPDLKPTSLLCKQYFWAMCFWPIWIPANSFGLNFIQ